MAANEPARFCGLAVNDRVVFGGFGEPDPSENSLPVGTAGTVVGWEAASGQLDVDWDNGSSLMLIIAQRPGSSDHMRLDRVRREPK